MKICWSFCNLQYANTHYNSFLSHICHWNAKIPGSKLGIEAKTRFDHWHQRPILKSVFWPCESRLLFLYNTRWMQRHQASMRGAVPSHVRSVALWTHLDVVVNHLVCFRSGFLCHQTPPGCSSLMPFALRCARTATRRCMHNAMLRCWMSCMLFWSA